MDWVQDMAARWMRILGAAGDGRTPLDEAVRQLTVISETPGGKGGFGRRRRGAVAAAETSDAVTVLSRQLIAGVLISDLMIDKWCALTGQSREQFVDQLSGDFSRRLPGQQLRALQDELSDSCRSLRGPEPVSYDGLGSRVEQLLRLAEEQATGIVDAARKEAAGIASSAGAPRPCPRCGYIEVRQS